MSFITDNLGIIGIILGCIIAVIAIIVFFAKIYKVADVDKVLIITGGKKPVIKISGGAFVIPVFRKASYFDLCMLTVKADKDEIKTNTAVSIIADWTAQIRPCISDEEKLRTAIISFKERGKDGIIADVKLTLMGAVRDVVASMTPEEILRDKERFKQEVQKSVDDEMDNMGLDLVSLNIQDVSDSSGYYENIAALDSSDKKKAAQIKTAEVERETREKKAEAGKAADIAEAKAKQATEIAKMEAELAEKEKRKDTDMKLAEFKTLTDTANADAEVAGELQKTIRTREVEQQKGAVKVMIAEQENLAAQKEREVIITRAEAEKDQKRISAEAEKQTLLINAEADANMKAIRADATIKVAESEAEAARKQAKGIADVEITKAEASKTVATKQAEALKITAEAQAEKIKAEGNAEAEVIKQRATAEAEGIKAKKMAEAEGEKALAEARSANDKVNFEIESLRIQTDAKIKIATSVAEVMANIGQNAEFINIGGASNPNITGTATGNVLIDTLMQIPVLMKQLDVQNEALNGRPVTDEVKNLSDAVLSGIAAVRKTGVEETTTQEPSDKD